jgi:dTDP-4-dehydrorhamnose reductase
MTPTRAGRALITGAGGQLGVALQAVVPDGWSVVPCRTAELDVTRPAQVRAVLERERPTVVLHAAAYTGVDAAESAVDQAEAINAEGTAVVAEAARAVSARLIYVSTDFVFDGAGGRPYQPGDATGPLGVYGRSKLEGERRAGAILAERALVVRTAWVYSGAGRNFLLTMLRLMGERDEVGVVCDQVGTPTWAPSLAAALWAAAARPELSGILHWTDAGVASWYDFAVAIQEEALAAGRLSRAVPIRPLATEQFPTPARRPSYSVLDKRAAWRALGVPPVHWRVNLRRAINGLARD